VKTPLRAATLEQPRPLLSEARTKDSIGLVRQEVSPFGRGAERRTSVIPSTTKGLRSAMAGQATIGAERAAAFQVM
jgi:hypothetical protein